MTDNVNHPPHYQVGGYEVYDILNTFFPDDPLAWQVGKYLLRFKGKNGAEDVRKMLWYGEKLAEREEATEYVTSLDSIRDDSRHGLPRVFASWEDVPDDVTAVRDVEGDVAYRIDEGWSYASTRAMADIDPHPFLARPDSGLGPFTEVIE